MDLAELDARHRHLSHQDAEAREQLRHAEAALARVEAAARADNAAAEARGIGERRTIESIRFVDLQIEYPYLPIDRLQELDTLRNLEASAARIAEHAGNELHSVATEFNAMREKLTNEVVAEHRAGVVHWDRRFHTSLAIGHGAAFAAIINHVFDKDTSRVAIQAASPSLVLFALGLLASGSIPWVLATKAPLDSVNGALASAGKTRKAAEKLAVIAASLFIMGVGSAIAGALYLGWKPETPKAAVSLKPSPASQTKPGSQPTSPSVPAAKSPPPQQPLETPAPQPQTSGPPGAAGPAAADRTGGRG